MTLARTLGLPEVFCLASGAMISSGLFVLPGLAFERAGPAVIVAYALAGLMAVPALLAQAELCTSMPRSGGCYFFIERSMGALPGTLAGLANWISISLKAAFALVGIGASVRLIWPEAGIETVKIIAAGSCVFFVGLNLVSVKGAGRLQVAMVAGLLAILFVFIAAAGRIGQVERFEDFLEKGTGSIFATAGLVFVSFGGLTSVASVAEEVHRPGRTIPIGLFAAWAVVTLLYVAAVAGMVSVMEPAELAGNLTPMSLAAGQVLGKAGLTLVSIGALLAFITTANGGILSAARSPLAMSRDKLLPEQLRCVSARFGTPHLSLAMTGVFITAIILLLDIATLVKAASTVMLILFAMVNAAVIIMRHSGLQNYRPLYRAPGYPWLQWLGIGVYLMVITQMGLKAVAIAGVFAGLGLLWYLLYVRRRTDRESALIYLVKRVVSQKIYRSELEEELKQIALQRDEVTGDRFDELIRHCEILDLPGTAKPHDIFRQAAARLAPRLNVPESELLALLTERENASSTVVRPGLAIPHVIVDGKDKFDVMMVRCRDGAHFAQSRQLVKIIFILVGSADQRNYHLRALMAIAQTVSEHGFVRRWLRAPSDENLRDLVLLSKRKRDGHHHQ